MRAEPWILMCPPDHYGIEYEINPWMNRLRQVDHPLAVRQWEQLRETLVRVGARISLVDPAPGLPDLVFTANAGMVYDRLVVLSRFRHEQRSREESHFRAWFEQHGFRIETLPPGRFFEGAGDALFCGDTLVAGYCTRSDMRSQQAVGELVNHPVLALEMIDPYYYHLDTCFCPLAPGVAIYFPGAFDEYGRTALADRVPELIAVDEDEARSFACNAVVVGRTVVTNTGCPGLHSRLKSSGYEPVETPLGEFVKAGGSAKCLTLRLDGEEAAPW